MSAKADKAVATTVGERLRMARDRQGLSLQKVSEDLHLDLPVLEAMEEDRFRALGAPVYARGHLRKYAQLLGLDVEAVLSEYEAAHNGPVLPNLVPNAIEHPAMPPARRGAWLVIALLAGAVVLVGSGLWLRLGRSHAARPETVPVATSTAAPEAAPESASQVAVTHVVPREQPRPEAASRLPPVQPEAAAGAATLRLHLVFSEDCWVEIYDAGGTRVFYDQGAAATARNVTAAAPLRVLLGNSSGVELVLDGRPLAIPERARYGATARFRVLESGAVLAGWGT
jgi:cytoskeleton protein RodZ